MFISLMMNQANILNTIVFIMYIALQTLTQSLNQPPASGSYLLETAIANGSIGAILFIIWRITFKSTQTQFEFALKQNQEQFDKALTKVEEQHKESLEQNQKTIDRIFEILKKDADNKEVLIGILTKMESAITNIEGKK
ncbi:hypothetical protein ACSSWA_01380 [Melioribacter sp. Ez-97]|uniref:hypothetical protein n=1 Tax=unclassified Melioribacter TaxID=2627329 RepID=UPI003ED9DC54